MPDIRDQLKPTLTARIRRQFVPPADFRFDLLISCGLVYYFAAMAPQVSGMLGDDDLAKSGGLWVGILVLVFVVFGLATDYTRRPLMTRLLVGIAAMLAYALIAWPFCMWAVTGAGLAGTSPEGHRNGLAIFNSNAGIPFVLLSMRCSRLLARSGS